MNLNRRLFLRGLGGAAVAAPFLSSVHERWAKAQGVPAAGTGTRLIVMFTHYGCLTDKWFPATSHGALTAGELEATTLAPLAPYASKLLMPRGMRAMNEWHASGSRGQGNDPHTQVVGSYFSCVPVTPNSDNPFAFDNGPKFNAKPIAPTLDHYIAQQISPNGVPLFMRVGGSSDSPQSAISYSAPEEAFPGIGAPAQAFDALTQLLMSGGGGEPMTPDTYAAKKGAATLDLVKDDLETLERFDMSMSDRRKLEAWKALLDDTGKVMMSAQCDESIAEALGLTAANVQAAGGGNVPGQGGGDRVTRMVADGLDAADIYGNIAVLSALCNANRVIFMKYPGNYIFSGLGLSMENHSISHRIGNAGMGGDCVAGVNEMIETMDVYYAEKFAKLVGTLDSIEEDDGTLLDNCAAVWFQEMSDGNAHNLNNMPIIQAGGCGNYFKTGQVVNLDGGTNDLDSGNSTGPCNESGSVTPTNTGTDPSIGQAPINKYYCNLMNALGVKANADGFPEKGGTAEVTKFGMYDRTEDFVGGNTNGPANITNPGEYTELKA